MNTLVAVAALLASAEGFHVAPATTANLQSIFVPPAFKTKALLAPWSTAVTRQPTFAACRATPRMMAATAGEGVPAPATGSSTDTTTPKSAKLKQTLKVGGYFTLWYILNIGYNIYNKKTLNMIRIPWIVATAQLLVGSIYIALVWALKIRKAPKLSMDNIKNIVPLAALHTGSHISAVIGLGAGAVGFVQIVKALEPLFTAAFSAVFLKQFFAFPVYLAMLPVVGGVALASLQELTFNWVAFGGAMGSNICAAARGVVAKANMDKPKGENMDAGNLYGVTTILATLFTIPMAAAVEGPQVRALWSAALSKGATSAGILRGIALSGLYFYLYNEVAFYCLNQISPVTHAVGNTLKRVVLIAVSVLVFGHKLTPLGATGSSIAIAGVLVYSLVKGHYAKKAKTA